MALRTHKIGLNANRPIVVDAGRLLGSLADTVSDPSIIADTGAAWVRLNFLMGPWASPDDQRRFSGHTWYEAYRTIVDGLTGKGLNIYGLIGHEAVTSQPDFFRDSVLSTSPQERTRAERWLDSYVEVFGRITSMFAGEVRVFESFNEPDDWHGGHRNWIHPTWFAILLDRIHLEVKGRLGLGDLKLITGPLQGLEINNNLAPTQYLHDTYQFGQEHLGWGMPDRPYPFDGVGYHIYIREGYNPSWAEHEQAVRQTYSRYVGGMLRVIRAAEGPQSTKKLYVSEIGWPSNLDTEEEQSFQARNVGLALDLMVSDPGVALGMWFCTEDFDPGQRSYGLYKYKQVSPTGRKPSFHSFTSFCKRFGGGAISGTLSNDAGTPRSGYQITLTGSTGSVATATDITGRFSFDNLPAGSYTLSIVGTNLVWSVTIDGKTSVTLPLTLPAPVAEGTGTIRGTITDDGGEPQPDRRVHIIGESCTTSTVSDKLGDFCFERLSSGIYTLSVEGTDLARQVWCDGEKEATVDIVLPASQTTAGIIRGTLRDHTGTPQPGRQVSLTSSDFSATTTTDDEGNYRFEGLGPASYTVRPVGAELCQTVWVDGTMSLALPLTLPAPLTPNTGSVRGTLRDDSGRPQAGYHVKLTLFSAALACAAATGEDGNFAFDHLPAGTYAVSVVGTDVTHPVWLDGRASIQLDLTVSAGTVREASAGVIQGTLLDAHAEPRRGLNIALTGPGIADTVRTNEHGGFRFEGLSAGVYSLRVTPGDLVRHVWSDGVAPVNIDLFL